MNQLKSTEFRQVLKNALRGFLIFTAVIAFFSMLIGYLLYMSDSYDNSMGDNGYAVMASMFIAGLGIICMKFGWPWSLFAEQYSDNNLLLFSILVVAFMINCIMLSVLIPIVNDIVSKISNKALK